MELKDVIRKTTNEPKTVRINLKTTKSVSEWLTKENISPQKIFDLAVEELIKKK